MNLSAMKGATKSFKEPPPPDDPQDGLIVDPLTVEECAAIIEVVKHSKDADEALKANRGDDDEYPDDDHTQDLWDALSLLDDCRDLINHLSNYKVHGGQLQVPRHLVAEMDRINDQITDFLNGQTSS